MDDRQEKINQRNLIIIVVILCMLLCGTLTASFYLSNRITNELRENAYDSLMNASEIIRQNLDTAMRADLELVSSYGEMLRDADYQDLTLQLSRLCQVDKLYHAYYVDASGTGISETGAPFDVGQLPVPETALKGVASISTGYVGETGQQHLCVQAPIMDGSRVAGALYAEVIATRYYTEEVFIFLGGEGRASLFNRTDGAFVIKAPQTELTYLKADTIFEAVLESNGQNDAYDVFTQKIAEGAKSIIPMQYGDVSSYIALLPCKANPDLYVATIISREALQVEADSISRLIVFMQAILILGLGGLIVVGSLLLYKNMKDRQMREVRALEALYEAREREKLTAALVKAQEANIAKTQFLSHMSHDMRTPMNAIIGMTTIAGQNIGDEEKTRECLGVIASSSHHLLGLISDILDMAKIESGNLELLHEPFALPLAMQSVASIITPLCKAKGQAFSAVYTSIRHEYLVGDKTKLNQVVMNLLSNANKFTPPGGKVELRVAETPSDDPGRAAYRITVSDDGPGIPEEKQDAVFDAFVRGAAVHSRVEGAGLGLSIARRIVEAMGGSLTLDSEPGVGATFTAALSFPIQQQEDVAQDYRELQGLKALVVSAACQSLCAYLADVGMSADAVASPEAALERLRARDGTDYHMLLMDYDTPGSGSEALASLRRAIGDAPILVITDDAVPIEDAARQAGANAFLEKPLFRSCLYEKLAALHRSHTLYEKPPLILSGKRVLVVEDNLINQAVARKLLEGVGAAVGTADDGQAGVDVFTASPRGYYDAILMDIQMPVLNGYEAAKRIRASAHPDAARIPIVALTANAFTEDAGRASEAGINAHLTKPIEPQALFSTLQQLMDRA